MGCKGLKWVVSDPGKARLRRASESKSFNATNKDYTKAYLDGPQMFATGTSPVVPVANMLNTFVYKNRTEGHSPDAENLSGA
mgnify:CR=1 FL=1